MLFIVINNPLLLLITHRFGYLYLATI